MIRKHANAILAMAMTMATVTPAIAQPALQTQAGSAQAAPQMQAAQPVPAGRVIVVSLEDRKLALVEDGQVKKVYTVAVGKPSTPSPVGSFTIESHVANPTYSHNGLVVPPGPGNPVGSRWMGLSIHGYGIHGTNAPKSIGQAASHGCIRMAKADLEEIFPMIHPGDRVEIVGQRNEQTARLFGAPVPTSPAAKTETAGAVVPAQAPVPFVTVDRDSSTASAAVDSAAALLAEE
jgi:lipoprotein-anchoring transpeptidase ErfK/SrfK